MRKINSPQVFSLIFHLLFAPLALAQHEHVEMGSTHHDSLIHLAPIQVLGEQNKSGILNSVPTVSTLQGDELVKKGQVSLGETLKDEAGVNSTQFGPTASRPVIRGLEGDRIRVLQNGIGILDVSGTSQDHAVPVSPLASESIEVVRGPITLLYGSSAVGGVVNIVNSRIHKNYYSGFSGGFDLKGESVNEGYLGAVKMDYGANDFMIHLDGDMAHSHLLNGSDRKKIENSEAEQSSGAIGATYFLSKENFVGLSYSSYVNKYGVVAESDVDIDLKQDRVDLLGQIGLDGFFRALQVKSAQTFYKHEELEGTEVGTTFKNSGNETRLEFIQSSSGPLNGIMGLQVNSFEVEAIGDEAFLPSSTNLQGALFIFEEYSWAHSKVNFGARGEFTEIDAKAGPVLAQGTSKDFFSKSVAAGYLYDLSEDYSTTVNLSYNERAPTYQELFANGAHVAVGIFERGKGDLEEEKSVALEWSIRRKTKPVVGSFSVFGQKFSHFVSLNPTGTYDDTDESGTPGDSADDFEIYDYLSQEALIYGVEGVLSFDLGGGFNFDLVGDYLKGRNTKLKQNLPRMSPARLGGTLKYKRSDYSAHLEFRQVFRQTDTAPTETETSSYQLVNLGGAYDFLMSESRFTVYGQVNNVFDQEARNHVSLIKDKMQLGGRGVVLGIRGYF